MAAHCHNEAHYISLRSSAAPPCIEKHQAFQSQLPKLVRALPNTLPAVRKNSATGFNQGSGPDSRSDGRAAIGPATSLKICRPRSIWSFSAVYRRAQPFCKLLTKAAGSDGNISNWSGGTEPQYPRTISNSPRWEASAVRQLIVAFRNCAHSRSSVS